MDGPELSNITRQTGNVIGLEYQLGCGLAVQNVCDDRGKSHREQMGSNGAALGLALAHVDAVNHHESQVDTHPLTVLEFEEFLKKHFAWELPAEVIESSRSTNTTKG